MVRQVWSNNLITLTTFNFNFLALHIYIAIWQLCALVLVAAQPDLFHVHLSRKDSILWSILQFLRILSMSRELFSRNKEPRSYLLTPSAILTSRCAVKRSFCLRPCVVLRYNTRDQCIMHQLAKDLLWRFSWNHCSNDANVTSEVDFSLKKAWRLVQLMSRGIIA